MQVNQNETPTEFKVIARNVNSGIFEFVQSMDDLVTHALNGIDQHQAAVVRPFLKKVIEVNSTPEMLKEFWSSTPSGLYFIDGAAVGQFLAALLSRLEQEPYLTGAVAK